MRLIVLVILQLYAAEGKLFVRHPTDSRPMRMRSGGDDPGEPLFLTPYVEAGNVEEGRRLARVTLADLPHIESYSGFFTVNKEYNSNQFLWYFPPMDNNTDAPVVLWLQGGPGASSLFGLFEENGPLYAKNVKGKLRFLAREYNWTNRYHLIYIDNPVGAGFSFTDPGGYCTNQTQIGDQLYSTVVQFFKLFPQLQKNKFFISGESYAGKYVPALGHTIHTRNPSAELKINLSGMFIGNGWCDPINQIGYYQYMQEIGMACNVLQIYKVYEWNLKYLIQQEKWMEAYDQWALYMKVLTDHSHSMSFYNYMSDNAPDPESVYHDLLSFGQVRKAIHVGNVSYEDVSSEVYEHLEQDMMKSITPWLTELLEHYRVIFYNGQLDVMVPYPLTVNFLRKLDFPESKEYETADRYGIYVTEPTLGGKERLIGYAKGAGKMGEVLVRNAGHMVPKDQPRWAQLLLDTLVHWPLEQARKSEPEIKLRNNITLIQLSSPKDFLH